MSPGGSPRPSRRRWATTQWPVNRADLAFHRTLFVLPGTLRKPLPATLSGESGLGVRRPDARLEEFVVQRWPALQASDQKLGCCFAATRLRVRSRRGARCDSPLDREHEKWSDPHG